jgi:adenylosuccinate synthase
MSVSVVIGGQFGSEGKGKAAYFFARKFGAAAVVRVGGTNSGHTVIGREYIFRMLPNSDTIPDSVLNFIYDVSGKIGQQIDYMGTGKAVVLPTQER